MDELITRARELAQAATPGPWNVWHRTSAKIPAISNNNAPVDQCVDVVLFDADLDSKNIEADAAFIAASRELVPALCDEVARVTDERDAWFSWAVKLGKKVGCLASTFPDSNSHISDAIDRLISSRDVERMAIKEYLNEIDGVRQVYRRIDLSNSEIEEAMFQENAAIETLRRAASGGEMNTNDEYKVQSPDALEVERLREELARWASGETFSQHAAEIYENLRAEVARLTAELAAANEAQRWIPVGERLPEVGVRVDILRTCPDGYDYQNGCLTADGYWWSEILACKLKHVTHWMPLPPAMEARNE